MMGHLGARVTVLLDGRMAPAEEERAWQHVHECHGCRDAVEREGWVKTHLAQWGQAAVPSSETVRAALLAAPFATAPIGSGHHGGRQSSHVAGLRHRHAVAWGGSAVGVAVMGLMALSAAPANAPFQERRTMTNIVPAAVTSNVPAPSSSPAPTPTNVSSSTVSVRLGRTHGTMVP